MKVCEKCKVKVAGSRKYCPLCQGVLTGPDCVEEDVFPLVPTIYRQYNLFFRLLIFASIVAAVVCISINILTYHETWWSLFVAGGIVCMWIILAISVRKRNNIPKNIMYQVVVISLLAVAWDFLTAWHGWSVDYVVPVVCTAAMIAMAILMKVIRLNVADLIIYFCINAMFGAVPLVLLLTGCLSVWYPTLICVGGTVVSLSAILLFQGEALKTELKRRLHI